MSTKAINDALEALVAAREEIRELPDIEARTALLRLQEAVWTIDEDLRTRDRADRQRR